MLPDSLQREIADKLDASIESATRVSGGSINEAAKLDIEKIGPAFLKWNRTADPDMFEKEVTGLKLLRDAETGLRVPDVILQGTVDGNTGYLLLEFIEDGRPGIQSAQEFGEQLAALHDHHGDSYGLDEDNYIGRLPQSNNRHNDWTNFFIDERMEPQLRMALESGKFRSSITGAFNNMYRELDEIFPEERPSLLHGDLWGGNYFYDTDGGPVIYDPAVYYGHREIELAFTHLFGGFSSAFYEAYDNVLPIEPGFGQRKEIYNLYPLLVHTNLFGGSYARQVEGIVKQFE
ncbi:fructosamine kinase family protein [Balneolaceae bacterium YR4-1]|uniref:Fructosamine kinase family protein n=1 Tax=Halalkalibaculum roseum TaxID=2709311 RepID=A0A6M1SJ09_9BACT|nr:fructosamine kinase family protein [Halalkalibaculum roseum]NGP75311.1 fructosamine kinase family protein [Halalkalibaculum roseum]